jgi:hypothetical protein
VGDEELIKLLSYLASARDQILEFSVDRPSLEESYLALIRLLEGSGGGQRL